MSTQSLVTKILVAMTAGGEHRRFELSNRETAFTTGGWIDQVLTLRADNADGTRLVWSDGNHALASWSMLLIQVDPENEQSDPEYSGFLVSLRSDNASQLPHVQEVSPRMPLVLSSRHIGIGSRTALQTLDKPDVIDRIEVANTGTADVKVRLVFLPPQA